MSQLRKAIIDNLSKGFAETMNYGTIGYVVPHAIYPKGYHCDPKQPLPFMGIASQKNYIALYHSGIYMDQELTSWFTGQYPKHCTTRLDMGKGCVRFRKMDQIPFRLIAELAGKTTVEQFIKLYERNLSAAHQ